MTRRRSPGALLLGGLLVGLAAAVLPLAAGPSVRAGALCPLDDPLSDFSRFWNDVEPEYMPMSRALRELTEILFDAPDDTVDRAGNPAEGPDILCAKPFVVTAGGQSVYETLGLDGLTGDENVVVVAPVTPTESLQTSPVLLFEPIGMSWVPETPGTQLGTGFGGGSAPNYTNPGFIELDGAHTWPGAFLANDRWTLDHTQYRNGAFTQDESSDLIVLIGPDWALMIKVLPSEDFADTWRSYVVGPNAVDVIDFGSWQPDALQQVSLTQTQPTPTPTPAAAPADTPTPSPSPSPTGGTPPASTTDGELPLLPLIGGALLAAGVAGALLLARSRQSDARSATSVSQVAAEMIAADVAYTPLVGRAWKETTQETSGSRTALIAGAALLLLLVAGAATAVATGVIGGPGPAADPSQSQVAGASEPTAEPSESAAAEPSQSEPVAAPPLPELAAAGVPPPALTFAEVLELVGAHSLAGVDGEYFPDSVNMVEYAAWVANPDQATADALFNATTFDCDNVVDGVLTACASGNPIEPGPLFVAAARVAEPISHESTDGLLVYSLVLDTDGDPANNYVAEPPFTNDFFQGTDRWYEMTYTPQTGWFLSVDRDTAISDARVAIMDDLIVFFVPMEELGLDAPGYRLTTFVSSDASFAPETSGGDMAPGPPDADFELAEPTVGGDAATGFLVRLGRALAEGDTPFIFDRLHSAVIERYGAAACQAYVEAVADPSNAIDPTEAGEPEQWDYVTDEASAMIDEAYPVQASATLNGQVIEAAEFHVAMEDGTFRWFTDCGVPAG